MRLGSMVCESAHQGNQANKLMVTQGIVAAVIFIQEHLLEVALTSEQPERLGTSSALGQEELPGANSVWVSRVPSGLLPGAYISSDWDLNGP